MIDLKQLMEERSALPPAGTDLRYPQIRRRITVRSRRRIALLATAAAVLLAIVGGYAGLPHLRVFPDPGDATTPSAGSFPPYQFGRKMVHTTTAPISSRTMTITFTPARLDFFINTRCDGLPEGVGLSGQMLVNNHEAEGGSCDGHNSDRPARTEDWARFGWIREGAPITITLTVDHAFASGGGDVMKTPTPMPSTGTISMAIYEPVPFEQYQFPPRPAQLPDLADWTECRPEVLVGDPLDPLLQQSFTFEWRDQLLLRWDTQTPGLLHFDINGLRVTTLGYWDYGHLNWSREWDTTREFDWAGIPGWRQPAQGEMVTITFTPEHFTGAWEASLTHLQNPNDVKPCG